MSAWNEYNTNGCHIKEATIGTITKVWVDELNKAFGNSDKWAMIKNRTNTQPPKASNEDMKFEDLFFINYKFIYIPFEMRMWLYENCGHYKDFAQTGEEHEWIPAFTEQDFEKKHKDAVSVLKQHKKESASHKISDVARRVIFMVVAAIIVVAISILGMIEASATNYERIAKETAEQAKAIDTQKKLEADPTSVHVKMDDLDISRFFDDDVLFFSYGTFFDKNVAKYVLELFYTDDIPTKDEFAKTLRDEMNKRQATYDNYVEMGWADDGDGVHDAVCGKAYGELFCGIVVERFIDSYHPERAKEILNNLEYTEAEF